MIAGAGCGLAALGDVIPPAAMITALMLLMAIVTNFVSNNAAAIIGTPVAIAMASALGADPRPFVLAVLFGCKISYATPMGYLPDQPAGHGRSRLPVQGLRARRLAAGGVDLDHIDLAAGEAVRVALSESRG